MFLLTRRKRLRAGGTGTPADLSVEEGLSGGDGTPAHLSSPAPSRTASNMSPPTGGSKSQGRWRSAPEVEDLSGIIGTREQVLAAIQLQQWRQRQAGSGGKVAPTPAKGVGGPRWRSAPEVHELHEVIGTREQVLACIRIQRWRRRPGRLTPAQSWDAASDDHEVRELATAEARHASAEGAVTEDQLHELARGPSQHDRRHGLPAQREGEREGERGRRGSSEREGGNSEHEELGSGPSTPSTADAAQSMPTTPPMPARPDLSPGHTASGAAESYTATTIPCSHPTDSHPVERYHSDRCAESGKLRLLCACAACTAPQTAVRRESNNER